MTDTKQDEREQLAQWMISHSFATGHGDSIEDLLKELSWQVRELQARAEQRPALTPSPVQGAEWLPSKDDSDWKRIFLQCLAKYPWMNRHFDSIMLAPIADAMEAYAAEKDREIERLEQALVMINCVPNTATVLDLVNIAQDALSKEASREQS